MELSEDEMIEELKKIDTPTVGNVVAKKREITHPSKQKSVTPHTP